MDQIAQSECNEYDPRHERRDKVAAYLVDELHIGRRILDEQTKQVEAIERFEARPYQLDAWAELLKAREQGESSGLIHLATGLGKTSVAVVDYAKFRSDFSKSHDGKLPRALFLCHQDNILEQANERFMELLPDTERHYFKNQQQTLPVADVTFATLQTMTRAIGRFPADYFDYIIYDEAHHIKAKTFERVVEHFTPSFQLALTATPERMDSKDITEHFGEALYSKTLVEAMVEGYLANVEYNIVYDDAVQAAMDSGFQARTVADINKLFDVDARNEEITQKIRAKKDEIKKREGIDHVKTIVFCTNIEQAGEMATLLDGAPYHSGSSKQQQQTTLRQFRQGGLEDIVVKDMFNEGVDIPDARLIVFLRSTQSKTIFEQQLGRGLRRTKDKDNVSVLDFVANIERMALLNELAEDIRSLAQADGPDTGTEVGARDGSDVSGVFGEFIFSQQAVNLIKRYQELKDRDRVWGTNEDIVRLALQLSPDRALGVGDMDRLSSEALFPGRTTICARFGKITTFQRECGFEVLDWRQYTKDELVELARELSPDNPLLVADIHRLSAEGAFPSASLIADIFGNLREFKKLVWEVEWTDWTTYTAADFIQLARELSPDRALQTNDISQLSKEGKFPSQPFITDIFGNIKEFQIACGFEGKPDWRHMTDEQLVALALEHSPDKPLSAAAINALSKQDKFPAPSTVGTRFGGMKGFHRACGFEVRERKDWSAVSDDALVDMALTLSPSKNLTSAEMIRLSKDGKFIGHQAIFKRFGSLKAFHAACEQRRAGD